MSLMPTPCRACGGAGALNDTPSHSDVWYRCLKCGIHTRMFPAANMSEAMKKARDAWEWWEVSYTWQLAAKQGISAPAEGT